MYIFHPFCLQALEGQFTNNKSYPHKDKPLTQSIAMEIISKAQTLGSSITVIAKHVCETHEKKGGLPAGKDLAEIVKQALQKLSHSGKANRVSSNTWRLPYPYQQIFGSGKHWVYLYYFDADKKKAKSDSMSPYDDEEDHLFWPCKVGKTDKDPENRVKAQTSGVLVPPHIGPLFRTDKHSALEKAIHGILTVRGRHLKKEWFLTNPKEVINIYDFIIRANPYLGL